VLDLVRLVHGGDAAEAALAALANLGEGARVRRANARRALHEVLAGLAGEREPASEAGIDALGALRAAAHLPGRSRASGVAAAVRALLGFGASRDEHRAGDASLPLAAQVRAAGERLIEGLPEPRSPAFRESAHRFFAHYALSWAPRPRDGGAISIHP